MLIIVCTLLFAIFISILLIFSSKHLSPIPYFPSNKTDLPLIIKSLSLENNQIIYDLGAGDGIIIFAAAKLAFDKKLDTKFIAVEINPILLLILHVRRIFHPNKNNIKVLKSDIFKMKFNQVTSKPVNQITVYLYISPWFLEKVINNCKLKIINFSVVSYMYPIKSLKNKQKIINGKNRIYTYI